MAKRASASKRAAKAPAATGPRGAAGPAALESTGPASAVRGDDARSRAGAPAALRPADQALPAGEPAAAAFEGQYRVSLPAFEGPLDLLLHLIQQHEIDILNIPVSFITEKYLTYLQLMRTLSIDIASEYLVMAATLVHIKSKMLLPSVPAGQEDDSILGEDEEDPRAELVRRLLEYQKYKAAAAELGERGTLGRDVFMRGTPEPVPEGPAPFASLGVFSLLDAFEKVLKRTKVKLDHEVVFDRISITDRIIELTEKLSERRSMRFEDLLMVTPDGSAPTRFDLVITFLAVLEMARLKLLKVYQAGPLEPIHLQYGEGPPPDLEAEREGQAAEIHKAVAERRAAQAAVAEKAAPEVIEEPAPPKEEVSEADVEPAAVAPIDETPPVDVIAEAEPREVESPPAEVIAEPEPLEVESPPAEVIAEPEPREVESPPAEVIAEPEPLESPPADVIAEADPPEVESPPAEVIADAVPPEMETPPAELEPVDAPLAIDTPPETEAPPPVMPPEDPIELAVEEPTPAAPTDSVTIDEPPEPAGPDELDDTSSPRGERDGG